MMPAPLRVLLGLSLLAVTSTARGQTPGTSTYLEDKHQSFGAFASPAALPNGATAAYAFAGVPEVGAGFRQGFGLFEGQARLVLDYFTLAATLEGEARFLAYDRNQLRIAPSLAVGATFDAGARYIDELNFGHVGLKLTPGGTVSWKVAETANLIGELRVPIDVPLTTSGLRVTPLMGGGAELYLGDDISAGALADFGLDVVKEPQGVPQTRFAFALRVGLGYRFF